MKIKSARFREEMRILNSYEWQLNHDEKMALNLEGPGLFVEFLVGPHKGRKLMVPTASIGYCELFADDDRQKK